MKIHDDLPEGEQVPEANPSDVTEVPDPALAKPKAAKKTARKAPSKPKVKKSAPRKAKAASKPAPKSKPKRKPVKAKKSPKRVPPPAKGQVRPHAHTGDYGRSRAALAAKGKLTLHEAMHTSLTKLHKLMADGKTRTGNQIAEALEVSRPTAYHHIEDLETLGASIKRGFVRASLTGPAAETFTLKKGAPLPAVLKKKPTPRIKSKGKKSAPRKAKARKVKKTARKAKK